MSRVDGAGARRAAASTGSGPVFLVAQRGDDAMLAAALRARRRHASRPRSEPFRRRRRRVTTPRRATWHACSWIVTGMRPRALRQIATRARHRRRRGRGQRRRSPRGRSPSPRFALLHTWLSTQTEGWWRQRLDLLGVPYDYISTQDVAATPTSPRSYDVILFPPVGVGDPQRIVTGLPMWGEPLPWKTTAETPNLGRIDATDDQRPGLGFAGLDHLRRFVEGGGLLVAVEDTAQLLIDQRIRARRARRRRRQRQGGRQHPRRALPRPRTSPVTEGFGDRLAVYSADGMSFELSRLAAGGFADDERPDRPTGRGAKDDSDGPQGRSFPAAPAARQGRALGEPAAQPRAAAAQSQRHSRRPSCRATLVRFGDAERSTASPACSTTAASSPSAPRSSTRRSARGTCCSSRSTRSGAARRSAAIRWSGTRFSATTACRRRTRPAPRRLRADSPLARRASSATAPRAGGWPRGDAAVRRAGRAPAGGCRRRGARRRSAARRL